MQNTTSTKFSPSTRAARQRVLSGPNGLSAYSTATEAAINYVEIDLQQTHGNLTPADPVDSPANYAALQFDGLSGAVHIYR